MGIKALPALIRKYAKDAIRQRKFSKFRGRKVAVDASLMLHQIVVAMRSGGKDMKNKKGELTSHLQGFFYKILKFLENEMIPIFVFDGKAPKMKSKTIKLRQLNKLEAQKNLEKLTDSEDETYIKNFKKTFKPTKQNIEEALILLDLMGIPYIIAPGEADPVCSWLASRYDNDNNRYVDGVCSDDSDMLPLGASYLFKNMLQNMNSDREIDIISLDKVLVKMNLTMEQFVDMCILLGCDYCDNLKSIGKERAYKMIQEHGSLEKILKIMTKKNIGGFDSDKERKKTFDCMIQARDYFLTALSDLDKSDDFIITDNNLKLRKFQHDELMDFMCVKHNFDIIRIQNGIKRLESYHKKLGVTRENTKKVHKILHPRSIDYLYVSDEMDLLSDSDDHVGSDDDKDKIPSKLLSYSKSVSTSKSNKSDYKNLIMTKKKFPKLDSDYSEYSLDSDLELVESDLDISSPDESDGE